MFIQTLALYKSFTYLLTYLQYLRRLGRQFVNMTILQTVVINRRVELTLNHQNDTERRAVSLRQLSSLVHTATEISKVESVQAIIYQATHWVKQTYLRHTTDCSWYRLSLELRRLRCDMIYVYKVLFGLVDLNFNENFTLRVDSATRGHEYRLFTNYSRLNIRKQFFAERVQ